MTTKEQLQKVAEVWADWNEDKISGDHAIHKIAKIFPKVTIREWRRRMDLIENKGES